VYEIWLMLNIAWELALGSATGLLGAGAFWLALTGLAMRRGAAPWRRSFKAALAVGALAGLTASLAAPVLTGSSLGEVRYLVDWLALAGIGAGVGVAVLALVWPAAVLLRGRMPSP
jgi:hypothetical protein